MLSFFRDGYIQAATFGIAAVIGTAIGRILEGKPLVHGPYSAAFHAILLVVCSVFAFIGVRRVRRAKDSV